MDFRPEDAGQFLERTPHVLGGLLRELPDEWLHTNEGGDTWSPFEVLGHLIHGERTDWIPRARIIIDGEGERRFEPFDRFAHYGSSRGKSVDDLLAEFSNLRAKNVRILRDMDLTQSLLDRRGVHPEFGEVTLRQHLATWVAHDWSHVSQISRVLATQYRDAVGPWQAYLPLLSRTPSSTPWDTRDRPS